MNLSSSHDLRLSPSLHVFEQEGGWHWGITVPRPAGSGFKVIAYSEKTFINEAEAQREGNRALAHFANMPTAPPDRP
ncbi:hypothetical protein LJ655_04185 [Paraburkholderia sp. MMS20-SJTN17]|uniref:DUF1508 domain-containing protein n=1 Tax=Paraburkholderia translucens TaxID=2886945 RepID=A0ABS8K9A7_9BURK|nr:hypothetical protein [Paraburkholderia sp. MMS20-SJTN17]MCC8401099.1 hypothetical protein [Paraburkholderia sp. MMS20-SJTN17]